MKAHESMRVAVLLFSDLVGSVLLQNRVGTQAYSRMLARHNELFRQAVEIEGRGRILNYTGDGFLAELPSPSDAVLAALRFQWLLSVEKWEIERLTARTALHLGEIAELKQPGSGEVRHVGMAINQVARLMDLALGNQILLSRAIWDDARRNVRAHPPIDGGKKAPEIEWRAHGRYLLKGTEEPMEVFEVGARGIASLLQPPDSPKAARVADLTAVSATNSERDSRTVLQRLVRPNRDERKNAWLCSGVVAFAGLLLWTLRVLDSASYDFAYALRPKTVPDEVVLVEMDSASTIQLNQPSDNKWDRRLHARVLANLARAAAKAVAFDIIFDGVAKDPEEDRAFRLALEQTKLTVLGAALENSSLGDNSTTILAPHEQFRSAAKWGVVERATSGRSIRRPIGQVGEFAAMNEILARQALGRTIKVPAGAWLNYYGPPGTLPRRSYISVLSNEVPASVFSNKVVFIGANTAIGYSAKPGTDYFLSPYTRWSGKESPGVEINATSYANLVRGDWLRRLPAVVEALTIILFGAIAGYSIFLLAPVQALIFTAVACTTISVGLTAQVWMTRIWFPWLILSAGQLPIALITALSLRSRLGQSDEPASRIQNSPFSTARRETTQGIPESRVERPAIPDHAALRCIGHGAYGEVWLARDAIGSFHAVKILRREAFKDAIPFEREFKGLQRYTPLSRSHPGLVQILHVGRNDSAGYIYYIMEAGDDQRTGQTFEPETYSPRNLATDISACGRIPLGTLAQHGIDIAEALSYLHRNGLIHRDIKPANIIFVHGKLKLADIGLVAEIAAVGAEISFIGTPGYMPPEGPGTAAGDVFSLGKLLYVAATGCPVRNFPNVPPGSESSIEQASLHTFMQILVHACEPMVAERYQSSEELLSALKDFQREMT
jgi:CHASE2 domain-containing sensor protein/class 3 adenylate cyclase